MLTPVSLYRDTAIELDENGAPVASSHNHLEWSKDYTYANEIDIILRDPIFIHHYFHFIELVIAAFAMISKYIPAAKTRRIYVGSQSWNNISQNSVQRDIIQAIFCPEKIVEGLPDGDEAFSSLLVAVVDRNGYVDLHYNKYIEPIIALATRSFPELRSRAMTFVEAAALKPMPIKARNSLQIKTLLGSLSATISKLRSGSTDAENAPKRLAKSEKRALYVRRSPPRTFSPELEDQFLQMFSNHGILLEAIDFSGMTWAEQVEATSRAWLLAGIHGNGLTNCLWMPPGATVIEIFPPGAHHYDYQMLSEVAALKYFGIEGRAENPFIFTSGSRFGAAYGSVSETVTELPWRWLGQILDGLDLKA